MIKYFIYSRYRNNKTLEENKESNTEELFCVSKFADKKSISTNSYENLEGVAVEIQNIINNPEDTYSMVFDIPPNTNSHLYRMWNTSFSLDMCSVNRLSKDEEKSLVDIIAEDQINSKKHLKEKVLS